MCRHAVTEDVIFRQRCSRSSGLLISRRRVHCVEKSITPGTFCEAPVERADIAGETSIIVENTLKISRARCEQHRLSTERRATRRAAEIRCDF